MPHLDTARTTTASATASATIDPAEGDRRRANIVRAFALLMETITASEYATSRSWVAKNISLGTLARPMSVGRILQVRVAIGAAAGGDMWFAFGTTTHPSARTVAYN